MTVPELKRSQRLFESVAPTFVENRGQWDSRARFLARLPGVNAWVGDGAIVYDFYRDVGDSTGATDTDALRTLRRVGHAVRMRFVGGSGVASAAETHRAEGSQSYFLGNDPSRWVSAARLYREVSIEQLYDGIDARILFDDGALRYDLVVAPNADPSSIALAFDGARGVRVDERGDLVIATALGDVVQRGLLAYQMHGPVRSTVECRFTQRADGSVGFALGGYDRSRPLVIDPVTWSRYVGHPGTANPGSLIVDAEGNCVITGSVFTDGYPLSFDAYDKSWNGASDAVITRIAQFGMLSNSTYIGGSGSDWGNRVGVDGDGNAYLMIATSSADLPTTAGAYDRSFNGGSLDAAIVKFNPGYQFIIYATYIGGGDRDDPIDMLVESSGSVVLTGETQSQNYPTTGGVIAPTFLGGTTDGYLTRLSASGASLDMSTFIGGSGADVATSIARDSAGAFYVGGHTASADLPTSPGAVDRVLGGAMDAFVAKIDSPATRIFYSTYIGGSAAEGTVQLEVDIQGDLYMAGHTQSADFPASLGSFQTTPSTQYAIRINSFGTAVHYATFLGAIGDRVGATALVRGGYLIITGLTVSRAFPTTSDAVSRAFGGGATEAYLTVITPLGRTVSYSTYLGGTGEDQGTGVGIDGRGDMYVSGATSSPNFPNTVGGSSYGGLVDFFVAKIGRCAIALARGADRTICYGDSVLIGSPATSGVPPISYRWTAGGDPIASDTARIWVRPTDQTVYIVTATDAAGCDAVDTVVVDVIAPPVFNAGRDTSICVGSSVRIGGQAFGSAPPFTYRWEAARGLADRSAGAPVVRPDSTTRYTVLVTDAKGCTWRDTVVVRVTTPPVLEQGSGYEICAGDSATLGVTITSGEGPFTYRWSPSTGLSDPTAAAPRAAPASNTLYRVVVTDANGCSTTSSPVSVTVGSTLRTRIAASGSTRLCAGESVTLDAGAFARYTWSNGATDRTIVVSEPGLYWVAVESASGCRGGSDTVQVFAAEAAIPAFAGALTACPGSSTIYTAAAGAGSRFEWSVTGGSIESGEGTGAVVVRWSASGTGRVRLVVTSPDGCVDSSSADVAVASALAVKLSVSSSTTLCEGQSVTLDAGADYARYRWSNGATARAITVSDAGEYWVDVEDIAGCAGRSDTARVVVRAMPVPQVTVLGAEICAGDTATLIASPGYASYRWSNGMSGARIEVTDAGSYSVEVTDDAGCRGASAPVAIIVHPLPPPPTITQSGDTLIGPSAATHQWLRDDVAIAGATAQRFVRTLPGRYSLEITDSNGCRARASLTPAERHFAWVDSTAGTVGERLRVGFIVDPPLRASDGAMGYTIRLRVDPSSVFANRVLVPSSTPGMPLPTMSALADGTIDVRYDGAQSIVGDTLVLLEFQGLATAVPVNAVEVVSAAFSGADVVVAGNGLVLLDGCDVGTFALGRRVSITAAHMDHTDIVVTYRAPEASSPTAVLIDAAGREIAHMRLEAGTGAEQQVRFVSPGNGLYFIELRDRTERSALPIIIAR